MLYESTDPRSLHQPDPEPLTQLRAATTLVALIQQDAPAPCWTVADDGCRLEGQLMMHEATDTERRQALAAWQRILGAGPVASSSHAGSEHIRVRGSYEGVPVEVATIVSASVDSEVAA